MLAVAIIGVGLPGIGSLLGAPHIRLPADWRRSFRNWSLDIGCTLAQADTGNPNGESYVEMGLTDWESYVERTDK